MLEAQARFQRAGLAFADHAVAVTLPGSGLAQVAESNGWLAIFPMFDWVGGALRNCQRWVYCPLPCKGLTLMPSSREQN